MFTVLTTNVYVLCGSDMLLIQRSAHDENKPLWWETPAGHVDILCTSIDGLLVRNEALRELREETGIIASPYALEHLPRYSTSRHMSYILKLVSHAPMVKLSDEHCDFIWQNVVEKTPPQTRYEVRRFLRDMYNA